MPSQFASFRRLALGLQALSFLLLGLAIWLDETVDLPHRLFHATATPFRPEEAGFETALLAVVAVASLSLTNLLLRRLVEARTFLPFCLVCQRVRSGERWTSVSDFLQQEGAELLDYGLCPDCSSTVREPTAPGVV
jgi:hypothetical protein